MVGARRASASCFHELVYLNERGASRETSGVAVTWLKARPVAKILAGRDGNGPVPHGADRNCGGIIPAFVAIAIAVPRDKPSAAQAIVRESRPTGVNRLMTAYQIITVLCARIQCTTPLLGELQGA